MRASRRSYRDAPSFSITEARDGSMSTALMHAMQPREVLTHWVQHLTLTRLAIAQVALRTTFYNSIYVPKASEGRLIP
ncbi:hypothetical protein C0Q44_15015 [Paenibacillus sp. PCH8]|uniref:hypothetical protein n=1 Tax=Paenibacillus sp. PCH8 TaxID=2066524 RepID=UPI000CF9B85E|nr:hypothetical protein [Paenibacillus sp. PCH8]PQP82711.1 hypothetical protein C0Q44_15015 [Paenibacillus sp. PCH8]